MQGCRQQRGTHEIKLGTIYTLYKFYCEQLIHYIRTAAVGTAKM